MRFLCLSLHYNFRVAVQETRSAKTFRMAFPQTNHANKLTPSPASKQGNVSHPYTSSSRSTTRSSDITLTNTQKQSTQRRPIHGALLEWLRAVPHRHMRSCIVACITILVTIAFGAGQWISSSRQLSQSRLQISQTTRQIEQTDIQIKQAALSLCSTITVRPNFEFYIITNTHGTEGLREPIKVSTSDVRR